MKIAIQRRNIEWNEVEEKLRSKRNIENIELYILTPIKKAQSIINIDNKTLQLSQLCQKGIAQVLKDKLLENNRPSTVISVLRAITKILVLYDSSTEIIEEYTANIKELGKSSRLNILKWNDLKLSLCEMQYRTGSKSSKILVDLYLSGYLFTLSDIIKTEIGTITDGEYIETAKLDLETGRWMYTRKKCGYSVTIPRDLLIKLRKYVGSSRFLFTGHSDSKSSTNSFAKKDFGREMCTKSCQRSYFSWLICNASREEVERQINIFGLHELYSRLQSRYDELCIEYNGDLDKVENNLVKYE